MLRIGKREGRGPAFWLVVVGLTAFWCACGRDSRLAGKKLRTPTVQTVTHYGVTLDASATPEQAAFVALRAIRDDVLAETQEDREAALDRQFEVCAVNVIAARNRTSVPRDEHVHNVVFHWAPTVAHYVADFPLDFEQVAARLQCSEPARPKEGKEAPAEREVAVQVRDPRRDTNASVVLLVWLAQDKGFWRVTHLGFDHSRRTLGG